MADLHTTRARKLLRPRGKEREACPFPRSFGAASLPCTSFFARNRPCLLLHWLFFVELPPRCQRRQDLDHPAFDGRSILPRRKGPQPSPRLRFTARSTSRYESILVGVPRFEAGGSLVFLFADTRRDASPLPRVSFPSCGISLAAGRAPSRRDRSLRSARAHARSASSRPSERDPFRLAMVPSISAPSENTARHGSDQAAAPSEATSPSATVCEGKRC
mmetsp:Transcript_9282/g.56515  ORF Transcript_9282/g.56515 Transcript_9282/m.56515 type:complete len:218 (-) Transcript_9282:21-674(-)